MRFVPLAITLGALAVAAWVFDVDSQGMPSCGVGDRAALADDQRPHFDALASHPAGARERESKPETSAAFEESAGANVLAEDDRGHAAIPWEVRLVDPEGRGVAGVGVSASFSRADRAGLLGQDGTADGRGVLHFTAPPEAAFAVLNFEAQEPWLAPARLSVHGSGEVSSPRRIDRVRGPRDFRVDRLAPTPSAGCTWPPLEVRLARAAPLRGRVVDRLGAGLGGALVEACWLLAPANPVYVETQADAEGRFAFTLPEDVESVTLEAIVWPRELGGGWTWNDDATGLPYVVQDLPAARRYDEEPRPSDVVPDMLVPARSHGLRPGDADVELVVAQGHAVDVDVRDAQGAPAHVHRIACWRHGDRPDSARWLWASRIGEGPTRFRLLGLAPGDYRVRVETTDQETGETLVSLPADRTCRIDCSSGMVRAHLSCPSPEAYSIAWVPAPGSDPRPAPYRTVGGWTVAPPRYPSSVAASDGTVAIPVSPDARGGLWIRRAGDPLSAWVDGLAPDGPEVHVSLGRGLTIDGVVRGVEMEGQEGLRVVAVSEGRGHMAFPDARGRFLLAGLPQGDWRLELVACRKRGDSVLDVKEHVRAGSTNVRLDAVRATLR